MKITELFDHDAVQEIVDMLGTKCVDGNRLTRAELCAELGLTEPLPEKATKEMKLHNLTVEAVVGSLLTLGVVTGFHAKKGPGGGIGKDGAEAPIVDKKAKKLAKRPECPEGFVDELKKVLNRLCVGSTRVGRKAIVNAMTLPEGVDMLAAVNFLSAAKAGGLLPGFASARGVGGGLFRAPVEAPRAVIQAPEAAASCESEIEAAPLAPTATVEAAPAIEKEIPTIAEASAPEIAETIQEIVQDPFLEGILHRDETPAIEADAAPVAEEETVTSEREEATETTETKVATRKSNRRSRK